jgi:hypothetical protein
MLGLSPRPSSRSCRRLGNGEMEYSNSMWVARRPASASQASLPCRQYFQAYRSILTLHGHNLGKAVVPNSIIAVGTRPMTMSSKQSYYLHSHPLSCGVQVPRPIPTSAQRLHQRELLPAHRSGANSKLRKASRAFSQRKCRGSR